MAEEEKLSKKEKAFLEYKTKGNDAVSAGQVEISYCCTFPVLFTHGRCLWSGSGLQQQDSTLKL
jgi:hypothetical protein